MATRRDLIDRRPSARPTTRRSFSSALRAQLPPPEKAQPSAQSTGDGDAPDIVHAPPVRSVLKKPTSTTTAERSVPTPAPQLSQKRSIAVIEQARADSSASSEASEDTRPKRSRTVLAEEERLEREQDEEYQEPKTKDPKERTSKEEETSRRKSPPVEDVVLTAVMQLVEEFIVEDLSREGPALLHFREELANTFEEERRTLEESTLLKSDSLRLNREKKQLRQEILATKDKRAAVQARIGVLQAQAEKLRSQVQQQEALHGLVSDLSELQESAAQAPAAALSRAAVERTQALNVAALLATVQENVRTVEYMRGLNATLAKCLERLDEL